MEPLPISAIHLFSTPDGMPDLGRGLFLSTRDMAKFGQLMLDGGTWDDIRIVNQTWVDACVTPYTEIPWADPAQWDWQMGGYGYQWWTGRYQLAARTLTNYQAWGSGQQLVSVFPELDLVIAATARVYSPGSQDAHKVSDCFARNCSQYSCDQLYTLTT